MSRKLELVVAPDRATSIWSRPLTLLFLTAALAGSAMAQAPDSVLGGGYLSAPCTEATAADAKDRALATNHRSPALDAALQSETSLWTFLLAPSTSYLDRMGAAYQGAGLVSAGSLPRLWKARAELEGLPLGVNPSPCEFILNSWSARQPDLWLMRKLQPIPGTVASKPETRVILGFSVRLPEKAIDLPTEVDSRDDTPWLWQVSRALLVLDQNVQRYYLQPDRYPAMVEAALRWKPANSYEQGYRATALTYGPHNATWVEAMVRLALEGSVTHSRVGWPSFRVFGGDDYHLEDLVQTALIVVLQQTKDAGMARGAALYSAEMTNQRNPGHAMPTATGVLAISRWATDKKLDAWTRYDSFASSVCRIAHKPPFVPYPQLNPNSPIVAWSLAGFETWLAQERPRLEQEAAREYSQLADLAAEIHQRISPVGPRSDRK